MSNNIEQHLSLLGQQVEDVVTGARGMVESVSFDVYGCVQAVVRERRKPDGTDPADARWVDVKRLRESGDRMLEPPRFADIPPGAEIGSADKPAP